MKKNVTFLSNGLKVAANLYLPDDYTGGRRAAVVVSHPFGGVKEQTAGLYAQRLAGEGFVALAFDASYQGESEGEPRFLENPFARAEDIKSAVTYLTTRDEVDPERIGALGICASGGYVSYAAQTEHRIKAVASVSGADMGALFREGLGGGQSEDVIRGMLARAGKDRTAEARGEKARLEHIVPETAQEAEGWPTLYQQGSNYYRTPRAQHPNSQNWYVARSVDQIAQYSSYDLIHLISPRPLLMIAGTEADTAYFSREAIEHANEPKELFWIDGASHIDLYDKEEYVPTVVAKLSSFFGEHLNA
ncbi:DeoR faimly transcriptional regulator [Streptomyces sp. AS58]|uniref:Alpha/beta hydrolase n=2 Tax=Streptomyces cadmiisoli TaxID=2184053 RepID=A0A2Z4JE12_9ACTN|nr:MULTISPECIES: alpha/beta hydrolase [Streptomyces]AWW43028.1 alpha/beta hydrolase [Streptomyces cadmiisoli]KOV67344.1 DeoR faimly transcriptional regulator [Streptomyces sp. AS58]